MYINLSTLKKIGDKIGVQGKSKNELLKAILNKLGVEVENSTPTLKRKVEMVSVLNGEILKFDSTYAAGKYFKKNNSCFIKKMNNGGGVMGNYHLLPDRLNEDDTDSNDENPSFLSNETNNIFNSIKNP